MRQALELSAIIPTAGSPSSLSSWLTIFLARLYHRITDLFLDCPPCHLADEGGDTSLSVGHVFLDIAVTSPASQPHTCMSLICLSQMKALDSYACPQCCSILDIGCLSGRGINYICRPGAVAKSIERIPTHGHVKLMT